MRGTCLAKARNKKSVEALVTQTYLQLSHIAWDHNGARSASLARHGNYEVRMVEFLPTGRPDFRHLWIELHDVSGQTLIDSAGCDELDDATIAAAEKFISQAEDLADGRRPGNS